MGAPRRYRVPAARSRVEDRIERSLFITTLEHAASVEDARARIERVRAEFPDATHHCFAFVIGPPGSTSATAASDADEPSGTAGRPMLKVLLNSGLGDVVAVVTRYYGGVKLGKGGLVRAYSGGVLHALREVVKREHVDEVEMTVSVSYALADAVRRVLQREAVRVLDEGFGPEVTLTIRVPADRLDIVERELAEVSGGSARLVR